MPKIDLKLLQPYLRDYVESLTQHATKGQQSTYICPICGSGSGIHHTGGFAIETKPADNGRHWHCFKCGRHGDIYDLCMYVNGVSLSEATKIIMEMYAPGITGQQPRHMRQLPPRPAAAAPTPAQAAPAKEYDFREICQTRAAALPGSLGERYLASRGITLQTAQRCMLGYAGSEYAQLIHIPFNPECSYFSMRFFSPETPAHMRHLMLSAREYPGIEVPVYNRGVLWSAAPGDTVFVVESPLCAVSIIQAGGEAIALAGKEPSRLVRALTARPTHARLLLCLDMDKPGRDATASATAALHDIGYDVSDAAPIVIGSRGKDPNEVLQRYGTTALADALKRATDTITPYHK